MEEEFAGLLPVNLVEAKNKGLLLRRNSAAWVVKFSKPYKKKNL